MLSVFFDSCLLVETQIVLLDFELVVFFERIYELSVGLYAFEVVLGEGISLCFLFFLVKGL